MKSHRPLGFSILTLLLLSGSASAQWQPGPTFPTGGQPRAYAAGVRLGTTLYALGGTPFTGTEDASAHQLLLGGSTFSAAASTEGWYYHLGAGVDALDRIVVFAGEDSGGETGEPYYWTPIDGNKGSLAKRSESAPKKLFAVATDAQRRIYAIGGGEGASPTAQKPNRAWVDRYDGAANAWTKLADLPAPVADAAACGDGQGHLVVIGGYDAGGSRTANVVRYDVATGQWDGNALPDLPLPLSGHRAALGSDGRIYVIGGEAGAGAVGTTQAGTWVLDLNQLTWTAGPVMSTPRKHFALALGADDSLYAMGGMNDAGGTALCETLFTPPCPEVTTPPADETAFLGVGFGLSLTASGGEPLAYQWRHLGAPIVDGPSVGGGTISGATTASLSVLQAGAADAGAYDCVVSNACGSTISPPASVTLISPPTVTGGFTFQSLHPSGYTYSSASAVEGDVIGGTANTPVPPYNDIQRPMLWSATTGVGVDLTPASSVGGGITAIGPNGTLAGWWWWPYTNQYGTGYYKHACVWTGASHAHQNVQPSGWEIGGLSDTDGVHHVGSLRFDESATNGHGFYWPSNSTFAKNLTPSGAWGSGASAIDGDHQFGSVHLGFGVVHAAMWTAGDASSFVDMNPAGSSWSYVNGARDGQQVGRATLGGVNQAALWSGGAGSFLSLHPAGASSSELWDAEGGLQIGSAGFPGSSTNAGLWAGTSASFVDLNQYVTAPFTTAIARAIDVAADGTVTIVGYAYNPVASRTEAVMWRSAAAPLSQDVSAISATTGGQATMSLDAGVAHAGETYLVLGSLTGTSPGVPLAPGLVLPLVGDAYTQILFALPNTLIAPSLGALDAAGKATATFTLPAGVVALVAPLTLHHAYVVFGTYGAPVFASNAVDLTIDP